MRKNLLPFNDALEIMSESEKMLKGNEYSVNSITILDKVKSCNLSAYDIEFVALAEMLNTKLITLDKKILNEFPKITNSLLDY
jgi:predicted nucleic acid-binding protein